MVLGIIASFSFGANFVFAGVFGDSTISQQVAPCVPPLTGDWIVISDCTLGDSVTVPQNVWVQNNSVLTIPNQVTLGIDFENFNLIVFSGSGILIQFGGAIKQQELISDNEYNDCSSGWNVTGYYIPLEENYFGEFFTIVIDGQTREFRQDFIDSIKVEGWGKTLSGDYLGWYNNSFHLNGNALDKDGNILVVGIIAVDPTIVELNSNLIIPTLPPPWDEIVFLFSDVGSGVNQKHIDVFTGVGTAAEQETFQITSSNNIVCQ